MNCFTRPFTSMQALFRSKNFLLIWLTSIADNLSLGILLNVQSWYVVDTLHMKERFGLVMVASSIPRLGLMLFGGVIADRLPKVKIMTVTFCLRVLVMACAAFMFWSNSMSIGKLIVIVALFGMLDAFFWPSRDALIPSVVDDEHLTQANTVMQATNQIGLIVGPALGGLLQLGFPLFISYLFTAGLMAAGAGMIGSVKERIVPAKRHAMNQLASLQEGLRYVLSNQVLRTQILIYVVANLLFTGAVTIGIPIIASEHLTYGARGLSYLQSIYACGMVLGFALLLKFPPRKKRIALICGLIVIEGVLVALQGISYSLPLSMALQLLLGFCVACNNVPMLSVLQQYTDRDKLGRVMSINSVSSMGLSPVSYAIVSSLIAGGASIGLIMPLFGLAMSIIVGIMALASPVVRNTD